VDITRRSTASTAPGRFRLPGAADPAPRSNHLATVCVWAAALGLGGMAVALRAFIGLVSQSRGWYVPTLTAIGLAGLTCTIASFASIRERRLPLILLSVATIALISAWMVTGL
jgi:hypothetical protein